MRLPLAARDTKSSRVPSSSQWEAGDPDASPKLWLKQTALFLTPPHGTASWLPPAHTPAFQPWLCGFAQQSESLGNAQHAGLVSSARAQLRSYKRNLGTVRRNLKPSHLSDSLRGGRDALGDLRWATPKIKKRRRRVHRWITGNTASCSSSLRHQASTRHQPALCQSARGHSKLSVPSARPRGPPIPSFTRAVPGLRAQQSNNRQLLVMKWGRVPSYHTPRPASGSLLQVRSLCVITVMIPVSVHDWLRPLGRMERCNRWPRLAASGKVPIPG